MPEISVIVPVYKVEKYLSRCIDSIIAQSFENFELLLIDDGSPDNCGAICDAYAQKDNRIKVLHKDNGGVSSARNSGLDIITGRFVSFVDSDDVISPYYLETLHKYADNKTIVLCDNVSFKDSVSFDQTVPEVEEIDPDNFIDCPPLYHVIWNKLIPADAVRNLRFRTDFKNGEDTLFAYNLISGESYRCIYVKKPLYGYFSRDDGAVNSIDSIGKKNKFDVMTIIYESEKAKGKDCAKIHNSWIDAAVCFFYEKDINRDVFLLCKKCLKKNLGYILGRQCTALNYKEKIHLLKDLMIKK